MSIRSMAESSRSLACITISGPSIKEHVDALILDDHSTIEYRLTMPHLELRGTAHEDQNEAPAEHS
jgi:hypothetical protein